MTADEVKRALQRVLSMKAFVSTNSKHAEAIAEDVEFADKPDTAGRRAVVKELAPPAPLCDEVSGSAGFQPTTAFFCFMRNLVFFGIFECSEQNEASHMFPFFGILVIITDSFIPLSKY